MNLPPLSNRFDDLPAASPRLSAEFVRGSAALALLAFASTSALAAGAATAPTVAQLWIGNSLAGVVAAILTFAVGNRLALAGIVVAFALWWAIPPGVSPAALAEGLKTFGSSYSFHAQGSSILVPLLAVAGIGARRGWDRRSPGPGLFAGPERLLEQSLRRKGL